MNTIRAPSVDEVGAQIEAAGGKVVTAKHELPNVGFLVYYRDPAGNVFNLSQFKKGIMD